MRVEYEWDVETFDGDDIVDHNHSAKVQRRDLKQNERLVLVRDVFDGESLEDRTWAYVEDGRLPERFSDSSGCLASRVPARFHRELVKVTTTASDTSPPPAAVSDRGNTRTHRGPASTDPK